MSKSIKQSNKIYQTIIISTVLHIILFTALIWSSFSIKNHIDISTCSDSSSVEDIIMVDPSKVIQNYNYQSWQQKSNDKLIENWRDEKQIQELKNKGQTKQQKQAEKIVEKSTANINKLKIDTQQANKNATKDMTKKDIMNVRKKSGARTWKKTAQKIEKTDKKVETKRVAAELDIDNFFSNSELDKNKNKNIQKINSGIKENNLSLTRSSNTKKNSALNADISDYAGKIKSAIESHFYNTSFYTGRICILRINLSPDGILLDVKAEEGDPALCDAALTATRQAKIPKPPSQAVYEVFKDTSLDFNLNSNSF